MPIDNRAQAASPYCTIANTNAPDITTSARIRINRRSSASGRFKYGWNRSLASVAAAVTILADSAPAQKNEKHLWMGPGHRMGESGRAETYRRDSSNRKPVSILEGPAGGSQD